VAWCRPGGVASLFAHKAAGFEMVAGSGLMSKTSVWVRAQ